MIYNTVPIDNVIGKIIRDTRLTEMSYTADMPVWISEVLKMLLGTRQLAFKTTTVKSCFHKGKLPCTMMVLDAVVKNGRRLKFRDIEGIALPTFNGADDYWQSVIPDESGVPEPMKYWGTIKQIPTSDTGEWYALEPGYLVTSFREGEVVLWYRAMPHDKRGMPLIPDDIYLHNSIYWYVRAKLIGTGWKDPVYGNDDRVAMDRFDDNSVRATSSMDFATPDMVAGMSDINLRWYPPKNYWETLGNYVSPDNLL